MHKPALIALLALALPACAGTGPRATAPPASAPSPQAVHDPQLRASAPPAPVLPSPVVVPLDADTLAALPREAVAATALDRALHCEGIALAALLRATGAMPAEPLGGAQLSRYVLVQARDGARAVFSLAELDPTLGNARVFLVDRCNGQPLSPEDGPLRLFAPDESRAARWVRQVASITVIVAP